jgi:hypothetical protein
MASCNEREWRLEGANGLRWQIILFYSIYILMNLSDTD